MNNKLLIAAAGLILALSGTTDLPLQAQADSGWIGKRVVPRSSEFTLLVNGEAVEQGGKGIDFYKIEQVDGPSLLLSGETPGSSGWAPADDVVLAEQGVEFFTKQIRAHPEDPFFHAARAFLWGERKVYATALHDYEVAIRLDPKNAAYLGGRGRVWQSTHEYDKAIADFDLAIKLDPKSARAFIGRGASRASKHEYASAIADFSEAIWLDPLAIAAFDGRGLIWYAKKEFAKAIIDFNMAIRLDSRHTPAYCHRASAWAALHKFERALADFNLAIEIDATCFCAHGGKAWILCACPDAKYRDGTKAIASATRACDLTGWKNRPMLDVLAAAYAEAGDFQSAVKSQITANALRGDDEETTRGQSRLELFQQKKPVREPDF